MAATLAVGLAIAASPALAQPLTPAPPAVLDGPSPDLIELDGMSIGADGTGGLVYLKTVSGVAHVFVSSLTGGVFRPPQQVDVGLPGASSQPVIAAGSGGVLQVAFINGGVLWVVDRMDALSAFPAPTALARGAANPSLQRTKLGKAYLAFTAADGSGFDVRTAFFHAGRWAVEPSPLNAVPADNAGTGAGRPQVAAAGDGIAIVVWGEQGHIYVRRVAGIVPSVAVQQADVPALSGWSEMSSAEPAVGSGGDSTYANVVFHEVLTNGAQTQERVLMHRLHASGFDGVTQPDGLSTPGPEGAYQPATSDSEYAIGFVTSAHDMSNQLWGTIVIGRPVGTLRIDSLPNATPPYGTSAMDGLYSGLVAWQHDPGSPGAAEIRARRYDSGSFGPEMVLSSPVMGPTDASRGITTTGDGSGEAAVAWVQGAAGAEAIVTDQLYEPPGSFEPSSSHQYARTLHPRLSWSPAKSFWGVTYRVSLDGVQIAQTAATNVSVPAPLAQGPHRWQVTATNAAGVSSLSPAATVFVDTVPPTGRLQLTGTKHAHSLLHASVIAGDVPVGLPPSNGSGVAALYISWGDRDHVYRIRHGKFHTYAAPGNYTVKVTIVDRAGNVTNIASHLHITPASNSMAPRQPRHSTRRAVAQPALPVLT